MVGGGLLWAFDVGGMEDFKGRVGRRRGVGDRGERGKEDEEEFEKLVASLTGGRRKEGKGGRRRWSAKDAGEERAKEDGYAVVEGQATSGRGKDR